MATKVKTPVLVHLDPTKLVMNKQVRTEANEKADAELLASVKKHGIMTPIQARMVGDKCHVIAGHRRTTAAIAASLATIPVYVTETADAEILALQMIENIQREGLSVLDTARGVRDLHNGPGGGLATYTAERLGKSNAWVSKNLLIAGGDKADTSAASIATKLLAADKIGDLESAYLLTKLEKINPIAAQEVADNIENETRATIKRRLQSAKPVKAPDNDEGEEEEAGPMWRWILKTVTAATVSKRDQPLQAAALAMIEEQLGE